MCFSGVKCVAEIYLFSSQWLKEKLKIFFFLKPKIRTHSLMKNFYAICVGRQSQRLDVEILEFLRHLMWSKEWNV